jgi:hypothetical protein
MLKNEEITETDIISFEENDKNFERLLEILPDNEEISLELLAELEEKNYDSLETDSRKTVKHHSTFDEDEE